MIPFILKSIFVSGVFCCWYMLALRNRKLHHYNRFFLLLALLASVLLPLLNVSWLSIKLPEHLQHNVLLDLVTVAAPEQARNNATAVAAGSRTDWSSIASLLPWVVSAVLLSLVIYKLMYVARLGKRYAAVPRDGYRLIITDLTEAPFSFFNTLFWRQDIPMESHDGQRILQHELSHIRGLHSLDMLFSQVLGCVFWMNPFYWIIQKELRIVHEFIADEQAVEANDTAMLATMILQTYSGGNFLNPSHRFFSSPIKRRIVMLQIKSKTRLSSMRRLMVLPLIAASVFSCAVSARYDAKDHPGAVSTSGKFTLMLDAGHGGGDAGGQSDQFLEKDLNLRIVKKLVALAPEFGIQTSLTRTGDEYLSPEQRVELVNKQRANAFLSVHVNDLSSAEQKKQNRFSVFVANNSAQDSKSRKFGDCVAKNVVLNGARIPYLSVDEKGVFVLKNSKIPAILMECGDIKNKSEMDQLNDDAKLTAFCRSLLQGVVEFSKQ
jgi:N-acetylmuramoyl-L-alanine amidase